MFLLSVLDERVHIQKACGIFPHWMVANFRNKTCQLKSQEIAMSWYTCMHKSKGVNLPNVRLVTWQQLSM